MTLQEKEDRVFRAMCAACQNIEGVSVFPSTWLAADAELGKKETLSALHRLRDKGLVTNATISFPDRTIHTSCGDEYDEGRPPIRGFALTPAGYDTEVYRQCETEFLSELAEWARNL